MNIPEVKELYDARMILFGSNKTVKLTCVENLESSNTVVGVGLCIFIKS